MKTAKEYLQDKYPLMRGSLWNSHDTIDDNWVAQMMKEYATQAKEGGGEEWINVKDRLPEEPNAGETIAVLVAEGNEGPVYEAAYEGKGDFCTSMFSHYPEVTYWMDLPTPPVTPQDDTVGDAMARKGYIPKEKPSTHSEAGEIERNRETLGKVYDVIGDNLSYYKGADGDFHVDIAKIAHAVNEYYKPLLTPTKPVEITEGEIKKEAKKYCSHIPDKQHRLWQHSGFLLGARAILTKLNQ